MSDEHQLKRLMDHAMSVLGLRLCYHDCMQISLLPLPYQRHQHPACRKARQGKSGQRCLDFDMIELNSILRNKPEGQIHVCPYGLTEIVVPVFVGNLFAGVLFAGPCWSDKTPNPYPGLPIAKGKAWLAERHTLLQAVAARVSALLTVSATVLHSDMPRRMKILAYMNEHLHQAISVHELAAAVHLSPSRTSCVVNQLFGMSVPNLHNTLRLQQAAHMLLATDYSVGRISEMFGYNDQNYFTRLFGRKYGQPPMAYRYLQTD